MEQLVAQWLVQIPAFHFFFTNISFQKAFSQSDFQKGPENHLVIHTACPVWMHTLSNIGNIIL